MSEKVAKGDLFKDVTSNGTFTDLKQSLPVSVSKRFV